MLPTDKSAIKIPILLGFVKKLDGRTLENSTQSPCDDISDATGAA